jgi:hypothetical protein
MVGRQQSTATRAVRRERATSSPAVRLTADAIVGTTTPQVGSGATFATATVNAARRPGCSYSYIPLVTAKVPLRYFVGPVLPCR